MPELIIRSGKLNGRKLVLPETDIYIGRDDDCQIRLTSADVSRRHCRLTPTELGLQVRDLGSRNGTFVNEEPVTEETFMQAGDKLRVGPMIFQIPGSPAQISEDSVLDDEEVVPKVNISIPMRRKPTTPKTTDDDIADWLSANEEEEEVAPGDTTIVPRSASMEETEVEEESKPDGKPKQHFDSIAQEAADIIRRHWEAKSQS